MDSKVYRHCLGTAIFADRLPSFGDHFKLLDWLFQGHTRLFEGHTRFLVLDYKVQGEHLALRSTFEGECWKYRGRQTPAFVPYPLSV